MPKLNILYSNDVNRKLGVFPGWKESLAFYFRCKGKHFF